MTHESAALFVIGASGVGKTASVQALEATPLARYRILLLDCEPEARLHRLTSRGQPDLECEQMKCKQL